VLAAAAVLATFVALANLGMCVEVVRNASGLFIAQDSANKVSSVIGFLAPIMLSAGVVLYTIVRLRASIVSDDLEERDRNDISSPPSQPTE
jgi:ABC-type Mn2+/Zn2+ transport system permease subunit